MAGVEEDEGPERVETGTAAAAAAVEEEEEGGEGDLEERKGGTLDGCEEMVEEASEGVR